MTVSAPVVSSALPPVVEQDVSGDISQYVNEDGSFEQGWIEGLVPEDLRNELVFKDMSKNPQVGIKDALKMLGNLQKVIGKKGIIQPTESSTPSEWDIFYNSLGRPEKPEGYKLEYPKELAESIPEQPETKKTFIEFAHRNGVTQKQASAFYDFYNGMIKKAVDELDAADRAEFEEAEKVIRSKSGNNYENDLHAANMAIDESTEGWPKEDKDKFLESINESKLKPYIMFALASVGKKFMESPGIPNSNIRQTQMTMQEAKMKMDEIAKTLADKTLIYNNPGLQQRLTKEMGDLAKFISSANR